ncbi:ADP-ribosylglycohydrolase family protein [Curtobacterium herbarum]|uniref:ADP-ribosylglycohydrolase family protein n=1 Tax=Curtobacterium herbarum TaxID=150122 RepID=A0ABN1ZH89_9MICO|nr:ADP-ribosylglycohydrolase family protein [Curtobacterium herbarum]MBM7475880.1 ADP-ribosylglycohydrolase [Curtobacterium herbarum]MCS6543790.1 ADP-ribosylglycohydrolase family protein [Curtobacterium herbarum]
MTEHTTILDRAVGAVLGSAAGDALGAGYEFGPPVPEPTPILMQGGGSFGWRPGEWTDDTSMAVPILQAVARGDDPAAEATLDGLVGAWGQWALDAPDVGIQTREVLSGLEAHTAAASRLAARRVHESTGRSAGNGSLMRTVPLVLAYLRGDDGEEERLASAARAVSDLTHHEADAGDACVLWCVAIRHAVLHGELDVLRGLDLLAPAARRTWTERLVAAEHAEPVAFTATNGWVVSALQAAYAAVRSSTSLEDALVRAVRSGNDTDTVAAIAGGLAGALYGAPALPEEWRAVLHGWPGLRADDLVAMSEQAVGGR